MNGSWTKRLVRAEIHIPGGDPPRDIKIMLSSAFFINKHKSREIKVDHSAKSLRKSICSFKI